MSSRRVTDEEGRVWECRPETEAAPGCDVDLVCTTTALRAPLRLKVSWQWEEIAEKGLARMITAAAARSASGYGALQAAPARKASRNVRNAKHGAV